MTSSSSEFYRKKLSPERIAEMRGMVEGTDLSYRQIGEALGLCASTVSRYAMEEGWQRPAKTAAKTASPAPPRRRPSSREPRERITRTLWRLAERHAEELEAQPIAVAQRALPPLARLTRALGEMDKHRRAPLPAHEYEIDAPKPPRSLHELRDELLGHLTRIEREERDYEERWTWTFENGAGI